MSGDDSPHLWGCKHVFETLFMFKLGVRPFLSNLRGSMCSYLSFVFRIRSVLGVGRTGEGLQHMVSESYRKAQPQAYPLKVLYDTSRQQYS